MMNYALAGSVLIVAIAGLAAWALRENFSSHLKKLEDSIRNATSKSDFRSDLPAEVSALAIRLGARTDDSHVYVIFDQSGQMWMKPDGKPMNFTARQTVSVGSTAFLWRARIGPLGWMSVADYLAKGVGGLEVRILGAFQFVRTVGGASAYRGEALRYLAELPWNPDAILRNRSLDWTVVDGRTIKVANGTGAERGEVTFELNDEGLVATASAPSRAYTDKGRTIDRPWHGRFWDYQQMGGRFMPLQGEVAWGLETGDFVYWRGRILSWTGTPE